MRNHRITIGNVVEGSVTVNAELLDSYVIMSDI